jgi:hypothetical protein
MKRSLSNVSFEFYQDDYRPVSPEIQSSSISNEMLQRASDSNLQSYNAQHIHSVSGNCCASNPPHQPTLDPTWQVKYRDNQEYDYSQDRNLNYSSWDHYSPEIGLDPFPYETHEISLSEISPAPGSHKQEFRYDGNIKYSASQHSLYEPYEEQVQDAYVNMYNPENSKTKVILQTPIQKIMEEEEYRDEDYDDDDEVRTKS